MTHQPNLNEPCNKSCEGCAYTNICIGKEWNYMEKWLNAMRDEIDRND
jgi:hypothetical protein